MAALETQAEQIRSALMCSTIDHETGLRVARHSRRQIAEGIDYCSERDVRRIRDGFTGADWDEYPDWQYSYRGNFLDDEITCKGCGLVHRVREHRSIIRSQKADRGFRIGDQLSERMSTVRRRAEREAERERVTELINGSMTTGGVVGKFATGNPRVDPIMRIHTAITEFHGQIAQAMSDLEDHGSDNLLQEYYGRAGTPRGARLNVYERLTGAYGKMIRTQRMIAAARVQIEELARKERERHNRGNNH